MFAVFCCAMLCSIVWQSDRTCLRLMPNLQPRTSDMPSTIVPHDNRHVQGLTMRHFSFCSAWYLHIPHYPSAEANPTLISLIRFPKDHTHCYTHPIITTVFQSPPELRIWFFCPWPPPPVAHPEPLSIF